MEMASTVGNVQADTRCEREIDRILDSHAGPHATAPFLVLDLPLPSCDALGRATWSTPVSDISKAYRNLSRVVHPDKIQDQALKSKARDAFEAVKASYAELSSEDSREEVLRAYAAMVKDRGDLDDLHNDKTLDEKMDAMGKELDERKRLREEEYLSMTDEIQRQVEEKRRRALLIKKKREANERERAWGGVDGMHPQGGEGEAQDSRHKQRDGHRKHTNGSDDDDDDEDDEDEARRRRRQQNRRRERKEKKR